MAGAVKWHKNGFPENNQMRNLRPLRLYSCLFKNLTAFAAGPGKRVSLISVMEIFFAHQRICASVFPAFHCGMGKPEKAPISTTFTSLGDRRQWTCLPNPSTGKPRDNTVSENDRSLKAVSHGTPGGYAHPTPGPSG
jgi:hypothetical protein